MVNLVNYHRIVEELRPYQARLVAVSKTKPVGDIQELLRHGQKAFGENYVQELGEKQQLIPEAEWHFIGHLQSKKAKQIAPYIALIHGIDSPALLSEVDKQAGKVNRIIDVLLQIHIAEEETKFGLSFEEADDMLNGTALASLKNTRVRGLMGMATLTEDEKMIRREFSGLKKYFDQFAGPGFSILSMGMTGDYKIALEEGSTLVRIGSAIFGERS